ncbi:MAG: right-handed parallel beta-helix repeat-containing protein [Opitutaceae bacterium]|jgi:hypothetical protein
MKPLSAFIVSPLAFAVLGATASARDLVVDARGGTPYATLSSAVAEAGPGDTIIIAKGSGPYRETLALKKSGTAEAPIVVEGNGETVTGFEPLVFAKENGAWLARLPKPFPLVLTYNGVRVLQDATAAPDVFLAPIKLREDKVTIELLPGGSPENWEVSVRDCAVAIHNASYQTYRNLVATGATNDGFNIHGKGEGLLFENIVGANNLDEGFSAHDGIACELRGGFFFRNENGIANPNDRTIATGVRVYDNLGWGLSLNQSSVATLVDVKSWNNDLAQYRFIHSARGTCAEVWAWAPTWTTRRYRSYTDSANSGNKPCALSNYAAAPLPGTWPSLPQIATTPVPPNPLPAVPTARDVLQAGTGATAPAAPLR